MKIMLTGTGQVGKHVIELCHAQNLECYAFSHNDLDISNSEQVLAKAEEIKPQVLINAAASAAVKRV